MKKHLFLFFVMVIGSISMFGAEGCKSDPTTRLSRKGEACQVTNDCTGGLSCIPTSGGGGVCVTGEFHVSQTAKECAVIQCAAPIDCCPPAPSATTCAQLQQECANGTNPFYCNEYNTQCKCDGSKLSCDNGKCSAICTTDTDCPGEKCSANKCVQCIDDTQCTSGSTCNGGICEPPCVSDSDCPAFNRCQDSKCVDSGCKTDRECVAATKHVDAKCGSDGKCNVPCQTDLECGSPNSYSFYSCINSQCVYVGCDSDKDCELYLNGGADSGIILPGGGAKNHIVCRDKAAK